jgi:hypothetical protein
VVTDVLIMNEDKCRLGALTHDSKFAKARLCAPRPAASFMKVVGMDARTFGPFIVTRTSDSECVTLPVGPYIHHRLVVWTYCNTS